MKKIVCDICECAPARSYHMVIDRRMDSAGSMEDIQVHHELCFDHFVDFFYACVRTMGRDQRREAYNDFVLRFKLDRKG